MLSLKARPGVLETENYLKRLSRSGRNRVNLSKALKSALLFQAGREIRVVVKTG